MISPVIIVAIEAMTNQEISRSLSDARSIFVVYCLATFMHASFRRRRDLFTVCYFQ